MRDDDSGVRRDGLGEPLLDPGALVRVGEVGPDLVQPHDQQEFAGAGQET